MEKRKDDLVKLVNISDRTSNGKSYPKIVVGYTYASNSRNVEDFLVVDREQAEHAVRATRRSGEGRDVLEIEELPEDQRTQEALSKSGEEVNRLKGIVADQQAKIQALEEERVDLLNDNAKLRSQLEKWKVAQNTPVLPKGKMK